MLLYVGSKRLIFPQIMDGTVISEMRTAAASAVATKVRIREKNSKTETFSLRWLAGIYWAELRRRSFAKSMAWIILKLAESKL